MGNVNKVVLIGNLGKDPEIRHMESGSAKASFSLATNEVYKNKEGERITQTEWHNIVLWRRAAEVAEKYLQMGDQVYVEGKLTYRSYNDREGNKRYITEIVAKEMTLLANRRDGSSIQSNAMPKKAEKTTAENMDQDQQEDDNLPF